MGVVTESAKFLGNADYMWTLTGQSVNKGREWWMGLIYVFSTIMLTVYGQLIVKWRVAQAGFLPTNLAGKFWFMAGLLFDPWIISVLFAAFLAALSWMAAMTKFDLSYAYPFMSLAFVLVMVLSAVLFHETITFPKVLGLVLVVAGIIVSSRG